MHGRRDISLISCYLNSKGLVAYIWELRNEKLEDASSCYHLQPWLRLSSSPSTGEAFFLIHLNDVPCFASVPSTEMEEEERWIVGECKTQEPPLILLFFFFLIKHKKKNEDDKREY